MIAFFKSFGRGLLITFVLFVFCVPALFADEAGDILVLVGGMDGPDPGTYPVTETVTRWIQSIIGAESGLEFRIHDSIVPLDEFSDFYMDAYEAGADKILLGFYDIEGSYVSLRLAFTGISSEGLGLDNVLEVGDDAGAVRFNVNLLNSQSSPPAGVRYFAHSLAASVYSTCEQYEKALIEINYAIECSAGIADEYLSRAYSLRAFLQGKQFNDTEAALADFDTALELDSTNDTALSNRAYMLFLMMRYEEALETYDTRIEIHPDYADAYYDRAVFLTELRYLDEALSDYLIAVELAPENPQYLYDLGLCYSYRQEFENALQTFSDLIEWYPQFMDAHADRAIILMNLGEYETAHQYLLQALEQDDSFTRVYNVLILTSMHLELWEDALEYANRGMELDPTDENFYKVAAGAYIKLGDFDSALYEFERTYEVIMTFHNGIDPQGSPVQNIIDLIDEFSEISEMDRNSSEYFYARGYQFSEFYVYDKAVEELSEAIRLDPDFEDAWYLRGLCCMKTGDTEQAITDFETVIGMTTNSYRKRTAEQSLFMLTE